MLRLEADDVYGEISQPPIDKSPESLVIYCSIDTLRAAIAIHNVTEIDGGLLVDFIKCGPMAQHISNNFDIALRGIVVNNEVLNIITFDVVEKPHTSTVNQTLIPKPMQ